MPDLIETTESNFDAHVLKSDVICCVYFNADWCRAGMELTDTIKAAANDVGDKKMFCVVDTDRQGQIVKSRNVRTIPTIHFVKKGKTVDELRGVVSKLDLLNKISAVLNEHDGGSVDDPTTAESTDETESASAPPDETTV